MNLKILWNDIEEKEPPSEKILLVAGSLGVDLAMRIDGHWYYKSGDNWNPKNLEYWCNFQPTKWADFDFPAEQTRGIQEWSLSAEGSQPGTKTVPKDKTLHGIAELSLFALL